MSDENKNAEEVGRTSNTPPIEALEAQTLNKLDESSTVEGVNEPDEKIKQMILLIKSLTDEVNQFGAKSNAHLKDTRKEIDYAAQALEETALKFSGVMYEQLGIFEQKITVLAEETFSLRKLPDKIEARLDQLVPNISAQIQQGVLQDFELAIANCDKGVNALSDKILSVMQRIAELKANEFKKRLITFVLTISISIFGSGILTYFLIQQFPSKVMIDTKGGISIDGSNVSIWGTGKNTVQETKRK